MKKLSEVLTIIVTLFLCSSVKATVLTVSNNPINAGQYTDLAVAYVAASVGDTLYVHGSPFPYVGITINKRITLIGAGYNDSTMFLNTTIGNITLDSIPSGTSASGTNMMGINFNGGISWTGNEIDNININHCLLGGTTYCFGNGWGFRNCILSGGGLYFQVSLVVSCFIQNNFINASIWGSGTVASGLFIDHNIITSTIFGLNYATISNNIFFGEDFSGFNTQYCFYTNNMDLSTNTVTFPSGTNTGNGNISEVFPNWQFNNTLTGISGLTDIYSNDWHLIPTSSGHNAASDGTDIGIYGGVFQMNFTGNTSLPQMTLLNIITPSIAVDSPLHVHFKARKSN